MYYTALRMAALPVETAFRPGGGTGGGTGGRRKELSKVQIWLSGCTDLQDGTAVGYLRIVEGEHDSH